MDKPRFPELFFFNCRLSGAAFCWRKFRLELVQRNVSAGWSECALRSDSEDEATVKSGASQIHPAFGFRRHYLCKESRPKWRIKSVIPHGFRSTCFGCGAFCWLLYMSFSCWCIAACCCVWSQDTYDTNFTKGSLGHLSSIYFSTRGGGGKCIAASCEKLSRPGLQ